MTEEIYDVIILGGGPAGLTTGIYTARHGLKTLLIERNKLGGKSFGPHRIENFPGFPEGVTGTELMNRFIAQAKKFGIRFKTETFVGLSDLGDRKMVLTRAGVYESKAIVLATGIQKEQLRVPGEMEFKGRGVCYCGICDGPFFTSKVVAVIGSGKEAVEDTIRLAENASKVYAIPGKEGYKVERKEVQELMKNEKIQILEGVDLESISGKDVVTHINLKNGKKRRLNVDGVFIILETVASNDIMKEAGIEVDEGGCIKVDKSQMTNISGIFAAGDCVCGGMQVVTAAGEGGKAGLSVLRYLKSMKI